MKVLTVGDLHGKHTIVDRAEEKFVEQFYDKLIFLGDYVDSDRGHTFNDQIACVDKVNRLTAAYPDRVISLMGNHEAAYLHNWTHVSGYQAGAAPSFKLALEEGYFPICWQYENWIFSHAGINKGWYTRHLQDLGWAAERSEARNLAECINALYYTSRMSVLFENGFNRGGFYTTGSPLLSDRLEMWNEPLVSYNQVIGHTRGQSKVQRTFRGFSVYFIDCIKEECDNDFNFLSLNLDDRATNIQSEDTGILAEDRPRS
jgi:hypothetical protein